MGGGAEWVDGGCASRGCWDLRVGRVLARCGSCGSTPRQARRVGAVAPCPGESGERCMCCLRGCWCWQRARCPPSPACLPVPLMVCWPRCRWTDGVAGLLASCCQLALTNLVGLDLGAARITSEEAFACLAQLTALEVGLRSWRRACWRGCAALRTCCPRRPGLAVC